MLPQIIFLLCSYFRIFALFVLSGPRGARRISAYGGHRQRKMTQEDTSDYTISKRADKHCEQTSAGIEQLIGVWSTQCVSDCINLATAAAAATAMSPSRDSCENKARSRWRRPRRNTPLTKDGREIYTYCIALVADGAVAGQASTGRL